VAFARRAPAQHRQVLPIHGENEIEAFEILGRDHARAQRRHVIAAAARRLLGTLVGRGADVISRGARRIRVNLKIARLARRDCAQHDLRSR
jgi:hypothetical protein